MHEQAELEAGRSTIARDTSWAGPMRTEANHQQADTVRSGAGRVGLLQRQCACGGTSSLMGTCSECEKKKMLGQPMPAKLQINESGDEDEREADRVAARVMDMPHGQREGSTAQSQPGPLALRRTGWSSSAFAIPAPPLVSNVLDASGAPLDTATRAFFEPRFGHDFGGVRVHADREAAASAHAVNARAYTMGNHIAFADGHYRPTTKPGQRLMAHELSHVLQQRASAAVGTVQRSTTEQPAASPVEPTHAPPTDAGARQEITIGGETFRLVAITESLTPQSAAWRYRVDVQDYLSAYPNLGSGWWAVIVRPVDGAFCNIGGNCLGWALGNFGLVDPPDQVWGLVPTYLESIRRSVAGHRSAQETYLKEVERGKIVAPAIWDYFMAQQFQAVPVESESAANLALYGSGFSSPMDGPSHIAFRTAGGELWLSKPSPSKPPIVHGTAAQLRGGQTGDVLRLYACASGPPNQIAISQGQGQGSPTP